MIKDIKYSGYTAQPSDYECPDGQLAASLNLIHEDENLKPLFPPKPILNCNLGGVVKLIHHVPNQDNYIIVREDGGNQNLYWLRKTDDYSTEDGATYIAPYKGIKDIAIVGNTLVLATDDGLRYILWKDGGYVTLASKPPFVSISFGMTHVGTCSDSEDLNITFERSASGSARPADTEENSNAVFGLLLSSIKEKVTNKGYFYMPFFVRYAYRLYDGTYSWHSAPILMLPMVIPPMIKVGGYSNSSSGVQSVPTMLNVPYFSLDYKVLGDESTETFKDWKDLIAGIDVFISAPIYTYDQSKRVKRLGNSRSILLYSYYDWNPDGLDLRTHPDLIPDKIFVGHYSAARSGNNCNFIDHFLTTDGASSYPAWELPLNDKFHDDIKGVNLFYKVSSIDVDSVSAMNAYKRLPLESTELDALVARQTLTDDYQSHCELSANYLLTFNSRLNLADVHLTPAKPFPLKSAVQATTPTDAEKNITITVYTRLNGVLCKVTNEVVADSASWDLAKNFPRYLYYPDSAAYKMVFKYDDTEIIIDLTPHDFLNGAYWYGLLGINAKPTTNAEQETRSTAANVPMGNKIYTSEVNNPFSFPVSGINTIGSGSILGISTAAKALSQGQFGQFPLYAFTTEGVWALEVGSNGFYTARQPITRDVCTNAKGITQIDNAVLFPSSRGIMLLSGANCTCISDSINSETPFDVLRLPHIGELRSTLVPDISLDRCLPTLPFSQFLSNCRMIYDYVHQRIIVFYSQVTYAYVYSLKSRLWGMMHSDIIESVPSYPNALGINDDNSNLTIVDFSKCDDSEVKALLVTRPLKLETPDVLKTMDTVIQRGHFQKGHVQSVLYGSRDLYNWHLVWSSKDHYLRGFRGTPYKYFRIALLCNLSPDESIFGASLQFTPRLTDQPR